MINLLYLFACVTHEEPDLSTAYTRAAEWLGPNGGTVRGCSVGNVIGSHPTFWCDVVTLSNCEVQLLCPDGANKVCKLYDAVCPGGSK